MTDDVGPKEGSSPSVRNLVKNFESSHSPSPAAFGNKPSSVNHRHKSYPRQSRTKNGNSEKVGSEQIGPSSCTPIKIRSMKRLSTGLVNDKDDELNVHKVTKEEKRISLFEKRIASPSYHSVGNQNNRISIEERSYIGEEGDKGKEDDRTPIVPDSLDGSQHHCDISMNTSRNGFNNKQCTPSSPNINEMRQQLIIGLKHHLSSSKVKSKAKQGINEERSNERPDFSGIVNTHSHESDRHFDSTENGITDKTHSHKSDTNIELTGKGFTGGIDRHTMVSYRDRNDNASHPISIPKVSTQNLKTVDDKDPHSTMNTTRKLDYEVNSNHRQHPLMVTTPHFQKEADMEEVNLNESLDDEEGCFTISRKNVDTIDTPMGRSSCKEEKHLLSIMKHCRFDVTPSVKKQKNYSNVKASSPVRSGGQETKGFNYKCPVFGSQFREYCHKLTDFCMPCEFFKWSMRNHHLFSSKKRGIYRRLRIVKKCADKLLKRLFQDVTSANRGFIISITAISFSIISTVYPTVPRYNTAIASMGIILHSTKWQINQSTIFFLSLICLNLLSVFFDIEWLMSEYYPSQLTASKDDMIYRHEQEQSIHRITAWYCIVIGIPFKIMSLHSLTGYSESGIKFRRLLWSKVHSFLPPTTTELPNNLHSSIKSRVSAIIWLEMVCAVLNFVLYAFVEMRLSWSSHFTVPSPVISLKQLILAKGASGLLLVIATMRKLPVIDFLAEFGCLNPDNLVFQKRPNQSFSIDSPFICFNGCIKGIDFSIGVLMWISLLWTRRIGIQEAPKEVRAVFMTLAILLSISVILCMVLDITVCW